ncbi:hypothetical protein K432DRAFT_382335 [Lepidopterella palustris CBS 459.81]|uniref:Uncharacterized protein n=1 Tax=Lepidopterella palustris CBS 459.81 TaxID=1314670 RepID=A0A8E2EAP1_9PEZI|nr:hypothetical protein K432DRAFT_382335 [Lepidopterella palustris CBS 459.81]
MDTNVIPRYFLFPRQIMFQLGVLLGGWTQEHYYTFMGGSIIQYQIVVQMFPLGGNARR